MKCAAKSGLMVLVVAAATTLAGRPMQAQATDPWAPFEFLIGNWSGQWSGQPGVSTSGSVSFSFDLAKTIIVRRTRVTFPAGADENSGFTHEDLLVIYREPGDPRFRAFYVDAEGFVVNYVASGVTSQPSVVFTSDPAGRGPQFKLVCEMSKDGVLTMDFLIAPPGGGLRSHVKCAIRRSR